jgi:hypothetical protein
MTRCGADPGSASCLDDNIDGPLSDTVIHAYSFYKVHFLDNTSNENHNTKYMREDKQGSLSENGCTAKKSNCYIEMMEDWTKR